MLRSCREFPSLSGAPQTHYQTPGQAVWANANQRAVQHTPVQRPQQQHPISTQGNTQLQQQEHGMQVQDHSQQRGDDLFSTGSQFTGGLDDYRHGGQGGVGQLSGTGQPQTGNIEEFPPLGRNGNDDLGQDRRGSLMQNAAFGAFPNNNNFNLPQSSAQNRQSLSSAPSSQIDRGTATLADRIMSPTALGFGGTTASVSFVFSEDADGIQHPPQPGPQLSQYGQSKALQPIKTRTSVLPILCIRKIFNTAFRVFPWTDSESRQTTTSTV